MLVLRETGGSLRGALEDPTPRYIGSTPTHYGDLGYDPPPHTNGETDAGGIGMPRSRSTWVSGPGVSQGRVRPAPRLTSVCLCLWPRLHWAPASGPHMMGGRPSARPAPLAIHHQPAATGGTACLFCQLRVAPWGRGRRKWPFSAWAGGWTAEAYRAPRAGPGWIVAGRLAGQCQKPCFAPCLSLPSETRASDIGIF